MPIQPRHNISNIRVIDLLKAGQPVSDCYIEGHLLVDRQWNWTKEIVLENCLIEDFAAIDILFERAVRFINCRFKQCSFTFSYFPGGLTITGCEFKGYLDFQAGGHNKEGMPVILTNNRFRKFVNFFDCWYEYDFLMKDNIFSEGTNILGTPLGVQVSFDIPPVIEGNEGRLDFNDEGLADSSQA